MNNIWQATITRTSRGNRVFDIFDHENYVKRHQEYLNLSAEAKSKYRGEEHYLEEKYGIIISHLNKNYRLLLEELQKKMGSDLPSELLTIDYYTQDTLIQDLLSSLENENYIKEIYKGKKLQVSSGLSSKDANILTDCIRQGRSLLDAGKKADMLAKPLIDFYAASAYAYAIIVINSPLHKSIDSLKGSHGHTYNHKKETIDFGGEIPFGTFNDLLAAIHVAKIKTPRIDLKYSLIPSIDTVQNNNISLSLMALLSMVPELNEYYGNLDSTHRLVHKLQIDTGVSGSKTVYNFYVGNGKYKPDLNQLEREFKTGNIVEEQGSYKIVVEAPKVNDIMPTIYQDLRGDCWYVESPIDGLCIPEICLHFLIISGLCNIMRYSPHEWSDIINNKISPKFSLLISEYIRLFEKKFPMLVTQYLTNYVPVII